MEPWPILFLVINGQDYKGINFVFDFNLMITEDLGFNYPCLRLKIYSVQSDQPNDFNLLT